MAGSNFMKQNELLQRNLALKSDPCDAVHSLYVMHPINKGSDKSKISAF